MIDLHDHPANWGILPYFSIGKFQISSYSLFVLLGLIAGIIVYYFLAREENKVNERSLNIALAGIIGGVIGAKIPIWILEYETIISSFPDITPLVSGRTITGGLIGGTLAVMLYKWKYGIKEKRGNLFAAGIALGVAIGRIGCFLRGCCYGIESKLPWAVDFGDGILRHPTQLYESIFMFGIFIYLMLTRKNAKAGYQFYILMNAYFIFRFFIEFIRVEPKYFGISLFQYISILALLFINIKYIIEKRNNG